MDPAIVFTTIVVTAALGFYMAWNIGANDVANSMADAVGSGALSVKHAVILAAICEFAGAVLVGSHVTETVRKGIVPTELFTGQPGLLALGMASSLLAAALWLHASSWFGMPVSTTHSIVGAIAGFGIVAKGIGAVNWGTMTQIVASWFVSPIAGGIMAFVIFKLIRRLILARDNPAQAAVNIGPFVVFITVFVVTIATLYKGLKHVIGTGFFGSLVAGPNAFVFAAVLGIALALLSRRLLRIYLASHAEADIERQLRYVERAFAPLVILTSCSVAFAHGANDVANAVGPLAAVVDIIRTNSVQIGKVQIPFWVLCLGGVGIVFGLGTYGKRVMETVGSKITALTPTRGVAADIAASIVVLVCSRLKLPISTTHTLVGAILGVGFARGIGAIDVSVTRNIFGAWLITVPGAAAFSIVIFLVARGIFFG